MSKLGSKRQAHVRGKEDSSNDALHLLSVARAVQERAEHIHGAQNADGNAMLVNDKNTAAGLEARHLSKHGRRTGERTLRRASG